MGAINTEFQELSAADLRQVAGGCEEQRREREHQRERERPHEERCFCEAPKEKPKKEWWWREE